MKANFIKMITVLVQQFTSCDINHRQKFCLLEDVNTVYKGTKSSFYKYLFHIDNQWNKSKVEIYNSS